MTAPDRARVPRIAITTGEPAGIGPELSLAVARATSVPARIVLIGDARLLAARARAAGIAIALVPFAPGRDVPRGAVEVVDLWIAAPVIPGTLDPANGRYVVATIDRAIDDTLAGLFDGIVTAPVQKSVINDAGVPFTGHTEHLAARTNTARVVMMLAGRTADDTMLRVALATTHLALADVPRAITCAALVETLTIIATDLRDRFGIALPRILVTGLNPHAGESGHLGREEIDAIAPAIAAARDAGIDARGPFPADTLFQPRLLAEGDAVLAMYHDQGLPVLKYATFGHGINVTLGLPIVRTSVDHGTALDLAASPDPMRLIDTGSMRAALDVAVAMAGSRT